MSYFKAGLVFLLISRMILPVDAQTRMIDLDSIKFKVYHNDLSARKENHPALIFENGWGAKLENWEPIIGQIGQHEVVFTYDRSGIGGSEYDEQEPTLQHTAENLHNLLIRSGIPPPYILIGHSLGGVYVRAFAGLYPEEVVGLVFVDPADFTETKEDWETPFRQAGVPEKKINEMLFDRLYTDQVDEDMPVPLRKELEVLKGWRKVDFAELREMPLPKIPLYFFMGGKFDVPPAYRSKDLDQEALFGYRKRQWTDRWYTLIDEVGEGGALIYVSNAGHFVHRDNPKVVIDNILSLAGRFH
ncbi:MAG: alpha/beta hydrolase [Saprospiraceae bacterium]|nr:alpha/beta hydrolase [Lewinella sp.]